MDRRETRRILTALSEVRAARQRAALATVIRVAGSAYRREGARMLIRENGSYECTLSGGCLEPAVVEAAQGVMASGEPRVVSYELDDEIVWGLGLGCGGTVDIRIERVDEEPTLQAWLAVLEEATAAVLVTALATPPARVLVRETGETIGDLGDPGRTARAVEVARARLAARQPVSGLEQVDGAECFFEVSSPPLPLVVFGAGHDAMPLVRQAVDLGLSVTVVDVRDAYLTPERFPDAALVSAESGQLASAVSLGPRSLVVIMNHHVVRDRESLRVSLESEAPYVGVLGPRSRFERLLSGLAREGFVADPIALGRVRSPVGLALGAETPEEVALSIVGEILAYSRGFDGGFLRDREGPIHGSASVSAAASPAARARARS